MKLPSIHYLSTQARNAFLRFPLTILSAVIAVGIGIFLIETDKSKINMLPLVNTMLCLGIGIPLYFCVTVFADMKKLDRRKTIYANLMATLVLVTIYFTFPSSNATHSISLPYVKYVMYNVTCHLLVSIIPFAFSRQLNGFWQYNKILFLRFLLSVLYSGFIYIGLILTLTALHLLFDIDIHDELYAEIWIVTIGVFNTWFFVSGIPKDFDKLDTIHEYPKGLKIFSQYVFLPLLALYLLILYAYGTKIIISANWPKGIVAYLIMFVSILGILTFLLLHPYGNLKDNGWIKKASRGYYFVLIPLQALLYIAIFMRINDYGITISRYAVLMLAIWISVVCIYTAFGKTNIKFIPTSLAIVMVLISFGPWGMFSVSERSQSNRLKAILEQSKILVDGKVQHEPTWVKDSLPNFFALDENKNEGKLNDSLHNEVQSIISYLGSHHGYASIQSWYRQDISAYLKTKSKDKGRDKIYVDEAGTYMRSLGLKEAWIYVDDEAERYTHYNAVDNHGVTVVSGYDYLKDISGFDANDAMKFEPILLNNVEYKMILSDKSKTTLTLQSKNETMVFELNPMIQKLKDSYKPEIEIPQEVLTLTASGSTYDVRFEIRSIGFKSKQNKEKLINLTGNIFFKKK